MSDERPQPGGNGPEKQKPPDSALSTQHSALGTRHSALRWRLPGRVLSLGPWPLVMGIVNVTPDSFSDGGQFASAEAAVAHGLDLVSQGADLLDVGGESTRPGAAPVPLDEELRRVLPVVRALAART